MIRLLIPRGLVCRRRPARQAIPWRLRRRRSFAGTASQLRRRAALNGFKGFWATRPEAVHVPFLQA